VLSKYDVTAVREMSVYSRLKLECYIVLNNIADTLKNLEWLINWLTCGNLN
jgi:hypothetical protein